MTRTDAISRARQHFQSGEFLKILDRRVGYRTESQQPNSGAALRAYLVEDLQPAFAELDFTTRQTFPRAKPRPGGCHFDEKDERTVNGG